MRRGVLGDDDEVRHLRLSARARYNSESTNELVSVRAALLAAPLSGLFAVSDMVRYCGCQ